MAGYIRSLYADNMDRDLYELDGLDLEGMMDAIIADCEAGNMAQFAGYHYPANYDVLENPERFDFQVSYLEIGWDYEKLETVLMGDSTAYGILSYKSLQIYQSCTNTIRWMKDNGLLTEESMRELVKRYGGPVAIFETEG
jgi:hypothetical protein